jgi:hypothetical protein
MPVTVTRSGEAIVITEAGVQSPSAGNFTKGESLSTGRMVGGDGLEPPTLSV